MSSQSILLLDEVLQMLLALRDSATVMVHRTFNSALAELDAIATELAHSPRPYSVQSAKLREPERLRAAFRPKAPVSDFKPSSIEDF